MHQASVLNGRQMVMVVVIGLHALVFSALMAMKIVVDHDAVPKVEPITPPLRVEPLPREKPPEISLDPVARRSMPSIPVVNPVFPSETVMEKVAETVVVIPA